MNLIFLRGGSRTAATSKMECFVIIVNGFQPLTIITKRSILNVAAVLDPPLLSNQAVSPTLPKSRDKNLNILRTKGAFEMK